MRAPTDRKMRLVRVALARRMWRQLRELGESGASGEKVAAAYRPLSDVARMFGRPERLAAGGTLERAK